MPSFRVCIGLAVLALVVWYVIRLERFVGGGLPIDAAAKAALPGAGPASSSEAFMAWTKGGT